jgi:hypothetical protein
VFSFGLASLGLGIRMRCLCLHRCVTLAGPRFEYRMAFVGHSEASAAITAGWSHETGIQFVAWHGRMHAWTNIIRCYYVDGQGLALWHHCFIYMVTITRPNRVEIE